MDNQRTIFRVNSFFLVSSIILIFFGGILQSFNLIIGILATEWIILLGLAGLYTKLFKIDFKRYRFKKISKKDGLITVLITLLIYPIIIFFSLIITLGLRIFFEFDPIDMPIPETGVELIILFFVIAVSAGICEEIFFRGLIINEFRRYGDKGAIVISAILFGIFHYNYQNFIGPVILGLFFGYIVLRTGSIWAGVIGHITNNTFALLIGFFLIRAQNSIETDIAPETVSQAAITHELIGGTIAFGVMTLVNLFIIYRLLNFMSDSRDNKNETLDINTGISLKDNHVEENKRLSIKSELKLFYPVMITIIGYLFFALSDLSLKL